MKHLLTLLLCWPLLSTSAQTPSLQICTGKTVSLIFPFSIVHVDRGSKDILVQQVKEADNILLLKAASEQIAATNLSIITSDGAVYSFPVSYSDHPVHWIYRIPGQKRVSVAVTAEGLADNPPIMHGPLDRKYQVRIAVEGIYIRDRIMYYQLRLSNESPINYDVDQLKLYIRDQKKGKRTAVQENEITPVHIAGNTTLVHALSSNLLIIALDKFTIPDAKLFIIQVQEKNGGRHLTLKLRNRHLLKAKPLPDLPWALNQ